MSTQKNPSHNLDALLIGTGEFSFSPGAKTPAEALLIGYKDFGNIKAFTPSLDKTEQTHKGSYRGRLIIDKRLTTEIATVYTLQCEEWDTNKFQLMTEGTPGAGHTQSAVAGAPVDAWAFTVGVPSVPERWYQITSAGKPLMHLTNAAVLTSGAGVSVTADATADTLTHVAHGLVNGNAVVFGGTAVPAGLTAGIVYYVINAAADTFKVAATPGGAAIDLTSTGTAVVYYPALVETTDYDVDLLLGRIRFKTARTTTITPTVTAPAITTVDDTFLNSIIPFDGSRAEGIGRLVCYDQNDKSKVVFDHRDFLCDVVADTVGAVDGTNWSDISIKVTVDADLPGEVFIRED